MQEFFVGNYRVDILRNQIICEGEVIALEPKVLEVLKVLAQAPGEVVSHQVLLDKVWPDIVVAPNALQRCIGQLRKALGDDGKKQAVIVTHPKKGYSLIAQVTLRHKESPEVQLSSAGEHKPHFKVGVLAGFFALVLLTLFLTMIYKSGYPSSETEGDLSRFTYLTPLTATDSSEFYSTFSPDGRYVAFSRNTSGGSHLWVKDLNNNREIQLTDEARQYGQPNWSPDGKRLAFTDLVGCVGNCDHSCIAVLSIYVPLALSEPQPPEQLIDCVNSGVQWVSETQLVFIRQREGTSEIVLHDSQDNQQQTLYQTNQQVLYYLSYSPQRDRLAVMQESPNLDQSVLLLSLQREEQRAIPFRSPARYSSTFRWYPVWDNKGENLLYSAETRLYLMTLEGELQSHVIPTFQDITRPVFHPDGNAIAVTLGKVDRDVFELTFSKDVDKSDYAEKALPRSILRETDAQFQPGGDWVAFFSQRSGSREIWLTGPEGLHQLSHFSDGHSPEYFVWSPSGKQLAAMTEKQLFLFDTEGLQQVIDFGFNTTKLFQWTEENNLLLMRTTAQGPQLVSFDLKSAQPTLLYAGYVIWAQIFDGSILFIDQQNQIKRVTSGQSSFYAPVQAITTWSRFFARNTKLYLLSDDDHIWQYDAKTRQLSERFHYPDTTVALTDVSMDHRRLLISRQMSSKKEIVMLSAH